ncbi:methylase [Clostridium acetobutylicum]|nr:methylase [Clostridium acetobutylicum]
MYYIFPFQRENKYSRTSAVKYALTYGLTPNPNYRYFPLINDKSGDCANFISQCLFTGNAPMDFNKVRPWWYKKGLNRALDTWSISWSVAHSLYYYLRENAEKNSSYTKGIEITNKKELEVGDLIFFQDKKGLIFHSTIVTSFSNGEPLITQHSPQAVNIPYIKSWPAFKYHYVKIRI